MRRNVLLLCWFLFTCQSHAASRFVDGTNGNDTNDGLTLATAWATIQHAFDSALPGDSVFIRGGTYVEHPALHVSGVVFANYPGEEVILDGDPFLGNTIITIEGVSHVELSGLIIQGLIMPDATGILIRGSSTGPVDHVNLKDLEVRGIGWSDDPAAIPTENDNAQPVIIRGETEMVSFPLLNGLNVHDNITGFSEAISLDGDVVNFWVYDCDVHDNTNIGIHAGGNYGVSPDPELDHARNGRITDNRCWNNVSLYATCAGIYVDGGWNTFIERNVCEGNGYGIEIGCEEDGTTENINVFSNVLRSNHVAGLAIGGYTTQTTGQVLDCQIWNNTFFQNDQDNTGTGEIIFTKVSTTSYLDNIIQSSPQGVLFTIEQISPQAMNDLDHNCWFATDLEEDAVSANVFGTEVQGFAQATFILAETASFFADPQFMAPTDDPPDLRLSDTSPCIDAGDPATNFIPGATDAAGWPRVSGPEVDIGAFEFQNPDGVPLTRKERLSIHPNPCTSEVYVTGLLSGSKVRVSDASGRLVLEEWVPPNGRLDVSELRPGLYFMRISANDLEMKFQRIIKR